MQLRYMGISEVMNKPLYVMVVDDDDDHNNNNNNNNVQEKKREPFRYTRSTLQSTLQLMGCKPRHAFKISQRVFELIRGEKCTELVFQEGIPTSGIDASRGRTDKNNGTYVHSFPKKVEVNNHLGSENNEISKHIPYEMYKKRTTVTVRRETFLNVVCKALAEYKYVGPNQRADLVLACRIRERKESSTVLLCGTSGCGKSTLSALLGSRLGITTVISTDSIRHMMRSFVDEKQDPLLWASTYHAGEYLDPMAVAEAKAKRKAKKLAGVTRSGDGSTVDKYVGPSSNSSKAELISPKQMAIEGFKAQSEMVIESLDRLITAWEERKESVVVEGVHLSLNFVMGLMKKHPSIVPFMVYISNEEKHLERFAVRAKYMTLDPEKNKYVKYIRNIRTIQDYLCKRADKHLVPKINNTNVDKSVAAIHATVFSCLRRRTAGDQLYDPIRNIVSVVDEEYRSQCAANSLTSKRVFQLIQRKGSSGNLMALLNNDGSVAKAWPVESVDRNGRPKVNGFDNGVPMYGPLQIGKAEPVNLQFGHFGISAWPSDGSTSHAGSYDESRAGWDLNSRRHSSCGSSDGPSKELKEDNSVDGSDEEVDDPLEEADSEFSDDGDDSRQLHDEVGSVDEESTKSDEEYDDLAMLDIQDPGYDELAMLDIQYPDDEFKDKLSPLCGIQSSPMRVETNSKNIHRLLRTRSEQIPKTPHLSSPSLERKEGFSSPSQLAPIGEDRAMLSDFKLGRRAKSIPSFGKHGSLRNILISSGAFKS